MAITFGDNISYKGKKALDERAIFKTIAEMKAYSENYLPSLFICQNEEDGNLYTYNAENTVDETTGKWRLFEGGSTVEANPTDTATENLTKIKIGDTVYSTVPSAGDGIEIADSIKNLNENELKVENISTEVHEDIDCETGTYGNLYQITEESEIKITFPHNIDNYTEITIKTGGPIGDAGWKFTYNLKELDEGTVIYSSTNIASLKLTLKEFGSNYIILSKSEPYDTPIWISQCTCVGSIIEGKKINVLTDDSITINDDNKLSVDLSDIETAIGKDEDDNLIKVADNIKDNAVNAYYEYVEKVSTTETLATASVSIANAKSIIITNEEDYYNKIIFENGTAISENDTWGSGSLPQYGIFIIDGKYQVTLNIAKEPYILTNINTANTFTVEIITTEGVDTTIKEKIEEVEEDIPTIEANPTEIVTDDLTTIKIGDKVYNIIGSGENSYTSGQGISIDLVPGERLEHETGVVATPNVTQPDITETLTSVDGLYTLTATHENYPARAKITLNKNVSEYKSIKLNIKAFDSDAADNYKWLNTIEVTTTESDSTIYQPSIGYSITLLKSGNTISIQKGAFDVTKPLYFKVLDCTYETEATNKINAKIDDETIKINEDNELYVAQASTSAEKIYDNDNDTSYQGKLWLTVDGSITISGLEKTYKELEVYYSMKDTNQVQYYKINTEIISSPKTNKGMFYICYASGSPLMTLEQVTVEYKAGTGTYKDVVITSLAGTDSEVKIERVYGIA